MHGIRDGGRMGGATGGGAHDDGSEEFQRRANNSDASKNKNQNSGGTSHLIRAICTVNDLVTENTEN